MKVMLHDSRNGLYYSGGSDWTPQRGQALDLKGTAAALKLAAEMQLQDAELVLGFNEPFQDIHLPLKGAAVPAQNCANTSVPVEA